MAHDGLPTYSLDSIVTDVTGTNEVQKVSYEGNTAGTFTLTFNGETTDAIAHNAAIGTVEDALTALNDLSSDEITVGGEAGAYTFTFEGAWGSQNVPALTATSSITDAEEKAVEITVETTTAGAGEGVIRGSGLADRTDDASPLAGESPNKNREEENEPYGDAE